MYTRHFRLHEPPFNVTPDPRFLYVNDCYQEAIAALGYGIEARKGFIVLVGEAGTGKTTLLRRLLDTLDTRVRTVLLLHPTVTFDEVLDYILQELGIPLDGAGKLVRLQRLNEFLLEHTRSGGNVALLIDEAQDLAPGVLEELRLLSNLETGREKILQIVLAGQPELTQRLADPGLRQLRQRVTLHVRIRPLHPPEVAAYVRTRLERVGAPDPELFTPDALLRVAEASGGIPRVVNVLCDAALLTAFAAGAQRISPAIVDEAWADQAGAHAGAPPAPPAPDSPPGTAAPPPPPAAVRVTPPVPSPPPPPPPAPRPRRRPGLGPLGAVASAALAAAVIWVVVRQSGPQVAPDMIWPDESPPAAPAPTATASEPPRPELPPPPVEAAVVEAPPPEATGATSAPPREAEPPAAPPQEPVAPAPVEITVTPAPAPPPPAPPPAPAGPPTPAEAVGLVEAFRAGWNARDVDTVVALFPSTGQVNRAQGQAAIANLLRTIFASWSSAEARLPHLQVVPQGTATVVRTHLRTRWRRADGRTGESTLASEFRIERRDGVVRIVKLSYRPWPPPPARRRPVPPPRPAPAPPPRPPAAAAAPAG